MNNGRWKFTRQMAGYGYKGFLYYIKIKPTGDIYIGKRKYATKTDWRTYKSSSNLLKQLYKELEPGEIEYICIDEYKSLCGLAFAETYILATLKAPFTDRVLNYSIPEFNYHCKEQPTVNTINFLKDFKRGVV